VKETKLSEKHHELLAFKVLPTKGYGQQNARKIPHIANLAFLSQRGNKQI